MNINETSWLKKKYENHVYYQSSKRQKCTIYADYGILEHTLTEWSYVWYKGSTSAYTYIFMPMYIFVFLICICINIKEYVKNYE